MNMYMSFIRTLLPVVAVVLCAANARGGKRPETSERYRPRWLQQLPERTNDSYDFIRAEGLGDSRSDAKAKAAFNLVEQIAIDRNVQVSDVITIDTEMERGKQNEITDYSNRTHASSRMTQESEAVTLRYRQADEYWEEVNMGGRTQYRYHVLYQVARPHGLPRFDDLSFTTRYGARGLWRSAIVPGWGQMYKGAAGKGWLFLGGEVALAGGIIATESLRTHYTRMAGETRNLQHRRTYRAHARNMATARNVCIAGAAAVYVWSLVDAIAAPGAKRTLRSDRSLSVLPYSSTEDAGIYVSFNF